MKTFSRLLLFVLLLMVLVGCVERKPKVNQRSPSVSPSAKYVLKMLIVETDRKDFKTWWQIDISDAQGNVLAKDPVGFPALFNIYWVWDKKDRLWVYNSDDGRVYYYEQVGGWPRREWVGTGKGDPRSRSFCPPESLFPDYAKKGKTYKEIFGE